MKLLSDIAIPFPYPAGHAKELEWGSFVYVLGYPLGNLIVTKGIVSLLPNRPDGEFTLDALLNKGCSGGIILAIRDGVPFETIKDFYQKYRMELLKGGFNLDRFFQCKTP